MIKPAIVRYNGSSNGEFTNGKEYEAYFVEYWQGKRNSLHVRGNSGKITDFNPFDEFAIVADDDNVLNDYEATVQFKTHKYDNDIESRLTYGGKYKAIGCDKDNYYLVMDDSYDCYFYPACDFTIIEDKHSILSQRSVYYSYHEER